MDPNLVKIYQFTFRVVLSTCNWEKEIYIAVDRVEASIPRREEVLSCNLLTVTPLRIFTQMKGVYQTVVTYIPAFSNSRARCEV